MRKIIAMTICALMINMLLTTTTLAKKENADGSGDHVPAATGATTPTPTGDAEMTTETKGEPAPGESGDSDGLWPAGAEVPQEVKDVMEKLENEENYKYVPLGEATFDVTKNLTLDDGQQPKKYFKDQNNSPLVSFVLYIMDYATAIMGTIAMMLLIIAGFMMMFSQGNQQTLDKAKDIFKYAVLGLVVAFMSYIIVIFIQSLFIPEPTPTP